MTTPPEGPDGLDAPAVFTVAEALFDHQLVAEVRAGESVEWSCRCGWAPAQLVGARAQHRTHTAGVVLVALGHAGWGPRP